MEREFQSSHFSPAMICSDEHCFNNMYSGVSLSTLLSSPAVPLSDPVTFGLFSEDSVNGDQRLKSINFNADQKLKMPKNESLDTNEADASNELLKLIYKSSDPIPTLHDSCFHHLPDLHSLEQVRDDFSIAESSQKRIRSTDDSYTLNAIVRSFRLSNYFAQYKAPPPTVKRRSMLARQRRQKISDKTRCLQKLMPWDRKMDMATTLEEAYKYVKFLQAQVIILQSMPCDSSFAPQNPNDSIGGAFGGLGRLSRQQLLQVLVNSPVAQTMLYSQGRCVFSFEQLLLLKKITDRKIFLQQVLFDP